MYFPTGEHLKEQIRSCLLSQYFGKIEKIINLFYKRYKDLFQSFTIFIGKRRIWLMSNDLLFILLAYN